MNTSNNLELNDSEKKELRNKLIESAKSMINTTRSTVMAKLITDSGSLSTIIHQAVLHEMVMNFLLMTKEFSNAGRIARLYRSICYSFEQVNKTVSPISEAKFHIGGVNGYLELYEKETLNAVIEIFGEESSMREVQIHARGTPKGENNERKN